MSYKTSLQHVAHNEEIICESLHLSGDVKQESIIDAVRLKVEGITRKGSSQYVKFADIHTHQGNLRCHDAKVTLLDGGEIHASTVHLDTSIGGEIYAQNVTIKHLSSDTKIYASHSITIEHVSGGSNQLTINYKDVPILVSKIDLINDDIKELESALQKARKNNSTTEKDINNEIKRLSKELDGIINSTNTAKITIKKKLGGVNSISFHLNDGNILSSTLQKESYTPFYLSFEDSIVTLHPTQETITISK